MLYPNRNEGAAAQAAAFNSATESHLESSQTPAAGDSYLDLRRGLVPMRPETCAAETFMAKSVHSVKRRQALLGSNLAKE